MIDSILYPTVELDDIICSKLKSVFETLQGYTFEGSDYNKLNFYRSLVFYDDSIYENALLNTNMLTRWLNAYYWYSVYLFELRKQSISIENHKQSRFKIIEQIDYYANPDFDWSIIEKVDNEFELK